MVCSQCKATVPEESAFCLRCGARLPRLERPAAVNGRRGGATAPAPGGLRGAAATGTAPRAAPVGSTIEPAGKQPYTLSFKPLADERLRYRVARFVCEVAPAHGLSDVQADLSRGQFATFLALTAQEADAARQRIEKLGAHPALWRLAPASGADVLFPATPREEQPARWTAEQRFKVVGVFLGFLLLAGLVFVYLWGPTAGRAVSLPTAPPSMGAAPAR
jgi:hypothetical protein